VTSFADPIEAAETDGSYLNGSLSPLRVAQRAAYVIRPKSVPDLHRRWVWIAPHWLGLPDELGVVQHRFYVEALLARGFHVAGIDVGVTFGSPRGAEVCQEFYLTAVSRLGLSDRVRLLVQSNGGLIGYAWAFRHANLVDRIFGIYPVLDFFTWPPGGVAQIISDAEPGLGYDLSVDDLQTRSGDFNPLENLAPLARAGVAIFHVHGDRDELVPVERNSIEVQRRYRAIGGRCEVDVLPGVGHGGQRVLDSVRGAEFLLHESI
jgi:pimeloyl-ACP methyl ester carboxylesterase